MELFKKKKKWPEEELALKSSQHRNKQYLLSYLSLVTDRCVESFPPFAAPGHPQMLCMRTYWHMCVQCQQRSLFSQRAGLDPLSFWKCIKVRLQPVVYSAGEFSHSLIQLLNNGIKLMISEMFMLALATLFTAIVDTHTVPSRWENTISNQDCFVL